MAKMLSEAAAETHSTEMSVEPHKVTNIAQTPRCPPNAIAPALTALTPEEQLESPRESPGQSAARTMAQAGDSVRRAVGLVAGCRRSKKETSNVSV